MGIAYADLVVDGEYLIRNYGGGIAYPSTPENRMRPMIADFRDRLRARVGSDWQISDIATFTGGGGNRTFAMRIRRMISGSPEGFEFVLLIGGYGSSSGYPGSGDYLLPNTTYTIDPSDGFRLQNWVPVVFPNMEATSKTFAGGWDSSGALGGGDFSDMVSSGGINPYANQVGFLNGCADFEGAFLGQNNGGIDLMLVLDSEENTAMFWFGGSDVPEARFLYMCGDIHQIDPVNVGDTYPEGVMWIERQTTSGTNAEVNVTIHGRNASGVIDKTFTLGLIKSYTFNDELNAVPEHGTSPRDGDNKTLSRKIAVASTGYAKGWLKPGLCLEMGSGDSRPRRQHYMRFFDGPASEKKYVKWTRYIGFLFPADVPFPFLSYPLPR